MPDNALGGPAPELHFRGPAPAARSARGGHPRQRAFCRFIVVASTCGFRQLPLSAREDHLRSRLNEVGKIKRVPIGEAYATMR